jgi:hypothetical protein
MHRSRTTSEVKTMGLKRIAANAGVLPLICLLSAFGCTQSARPLDREPDFLGFITEISTLKEQGLAGQVTIESHADKIVTRYIVTVKNDTLIFNEDGDNLRRLGFQTLRLRQWAKIWVRGPGSRVFPVAGNSRADSDNGGTVAAVFRFIVRGTASGITATSSSESTAVGYRGRASRASPTGSTELTPAAQRPR